MLTSAVPSSSTPPVAHQALFNGTGRGDSCPDLADGGMEVKKVKRDVDVAGFGAAELGQNGAVGMCAPEACLQLQGGCSDPHARAGALQRTPPQVSCQPQPAGPPLSRPAQESKPDEGHHATPSPAPKLAPEGPLASSSSMAPSRGLESVESLIEELLERAPVAAPQGGGDSNGQGISIEAFHQELRELEERVRERRSAAQALEELGREPPASSDPAEDEPQHVPPLEAEPRAGEARTDNAAGEFFSPARPLGQPAAPPYTGTPHIHKLFMRICSSVFV